MCFVYILDGNALVIGAFENHKYDNGGKTDSHYVTITYNSATNTYKWENKADQSWTLYSTSIYNVLRVGTNANYDFGQTTVQFNQMGIYGPGNEFYTKTGW